MSPIILTGTGKYFNYLHPDDYQFDIHFIAHSLSNICRFAGHTSSFYSVAQHSVLVSQIVPEEFAFDGLMHDSSEAFVCDIPKPLKELLPEYSAIEKLVEGAIFRFFGIPDKLDPSIKHADLVMLATEARDLMPFHREVWPQLEGINPLPEHIDPLPPAEALKLFEQRYAKLAQRRPKHAFIGQ